MANIDATRDALRALRDRFTAAGINDEFRARAIPPGEGDIEWHLVCVDIHERQIPGVLPVGFRPTVCDIEDVPLWIPPQPERVVRA